jgi:hypothetical protein
MEEYFLDKVNLVMVVWLKLIPILAAALKNTTYFKRGQK